MSGESPDPYWEIVSWETAAEYPADLILYDGRATAPSLDELADIPLRTKLPAVQADHLTPWHMEEGIGYKLFTEHIKQLTAAVERSDMVAV